jgi:hypothetical protein
MAAQTTISDKGKGKMASTQDGDDLTAGQTNRAQSGTELLADQAQLGDGNDYILQVRHEAISAGVGAIRATAAAFGLIAEAATGVGGGGIGVLGSGRRGVEGHGEIAGVIGQGGDSAGRALEPLASGGTGVIGQGGGDGFEAGDGVLGQARGFGAGVHGSAASPLGRGIVGVYGEADDTLAVAGIAQTGTAILGSVTDESGFAGRFRGQVVIESGSLTVHGPGGVVIDGPLLVSGAKSAVVSMPGGSHRALYSIESPESWFEDFGESSLNNGRAEIALEPAFAETIVTDRYHVFVTPYGDSNGLYVTNRRATGFTVQEQHAGTSNLTFSYRVVAKRRDVTAHRMAQVRLPKPPRTPELPRQR